MPTKDDDGFLMPSQTTDSEEFERETDWFHYFYVSLTIALALTSAKMTWEGMLVAVVPGGNISPEFAVALTLVGSALIVFCALAGEKYIKTKGMKATILDIFVYFVIFAFISGACIYVISTKYSVIAIGLAESTKENMRDIGEQLTIAAMFLEGNNRKLKLIKGVLETNAAVARSSARDEKKALEVGRNYTNLQGVVTRLKTESRKMGDRNAFSKGLKAIQNQIIKLNEIYQKDTNSFELNDIRKDYSAGLSKIKMDFKGLPTEYISNTVKSLEKFLSKCSKNSDELYKELEKRYGDNPLGEQEAYLTRIKNAGDMCENASESLKKASIDADKSEKEKTEKFKDAKQINISIRDTEELNGVIKNLKLWAPKDVVSKYPYLQAWGYAIVFDFFWYFVLLAYLYHEKIIRKREGVRRPMSAPLI